VKRNHVEVYDDHVTVAFIGSSRASLLSPVLSDPIPVPAPLGKYSSELQLTADDPVIVILRDELTNRLIDVQIWDKLPAWWHDDPVEEPELNPEYVEAYEALRKVQDEDESGSPG
jgi:hypothetical protein